MSKDQGGGCEDGHATILAFPGSPLTGKLMAERIDVPRDCLRNFLSRSGPHVGETCAYVATRIDRDLDAPINGETHHRTAKPRDARGTRRTTPVENFEDKGVGQKPPEQCFRPAQAMRILAATRKDHAPVVRRKGTFERDPTETSMSGMDRKCEALRRRRGRHSSSGERPDRTLIAVRSCCFLTEMGSVLPSSSRSISAATAITASSTFR